MNKGPTEVQPVGVACPTRIKHEARSKQKECTAWNLDERPGEIQLEQDLDWNGREGMPADGDNPCIMLTRLGSRLGYERAAVVGRMARQQLGR